MCIPLELAGLVLVFSAVQVRSGGLDLAAVLVAALAPLFLATELLAGTIMTAFLAACWGAAGALPLHGIGRLAAGGALFAVSFSVQVGIGHAIFERGRDDTSMNLAEFARTWNPVPLLLVPYYHLVEALLALGYRPGLRRQIEAFMRQEMASAGLGSGGADESPSHG